MASKDIQLDHRIIYSIIEPESRVLDLGCGEGSEYGDAAGPPTWSDGLRLEPRRGADRVGVV